MSETRTTGDGSSADGADGDGDRPVPTGRVPDLDYFGGAVAPAAASAVGGSAQVGGGSQFGGGNQRFGSGNQQFGGSAQQTAVPAPFGTPVPAGPRPGRENQRSAWKVVAAGGALVLALVAFFGGRFAWQQFVADPVVPETLAGQPRMPGAEDDPAMGDALRELVDDQLTPGSDAKVGFYTSGQGSGYILVAIRGGARGGGDGQDAFQGWTETSHDGTTCHSKPAQAASGMGVTVCARGFFRRAVVVFGLGLTPPEPAVVASATQEAWDAQ